MGRLWQEGEKEGGRGEGRNYIFFVVVVMVVVYFDLSFIHFCLWFRGGRLQKEEREG